MHKIARLKESDKPHHEWENLDELGEILNIIHLSFALLTFVVGLGFIISLCKRSKATDWTRATDPNIKEKFQ